MITLDTSAVIASVDSDDSANGEILAYLELYVGRIVLPMPIFSEIAFVSQSRLGRDHSPQILASVEAGEVILDTNLRSRRITELINRYADLRLGFSDACVIACAESNGGNVLTLDRRDFDVVAAEGTITVYPNGPGLSFTDI